MIFCSLGFDAPDNYNLSDFYIQTLAILPFDRESSFERVHVRRKDCLYIHICHICLRSMYAINTKVLLFMHNMLPRLNNFIRLMTINRWQTADYSIEQQSMSNVDLSTALLLDMTYSDIEQIFSHNFVAFSGVRLLIHFVIHSNYVFVLFYRLSLVYSSVLFFYVLNTIN
jgi:hypothetical protein